MKDFFSSCIRRNSILFLFVITVPRLLPAQDTLHVLTEDDFLQIVRSNHPIAKQARFLVDIASAQLLSARGNFDPVLSVNNSRKTFDTKNYYNYTNAEMILPTWFGIELYGGLENNSGEYINRENTFGKSSYAGISIPLAKDLLLDKRRATLQQGKLFAQQSGAEQRTIVNDLLFEAYKSYWSWAKDYSVLLVFDTAIALNQNRYELVRISFQQGDRAAIDTTEALAQLQSFQQQREEAWIRFRKSSLELSTFLWLPGNKPVYLQEWVIPDTMWAKKNMLSFKLEELGNWISKTISSHPKLQQLDFKLQWLEVERRLKFQSLLPKIDVKYNFLQSGYGMGEALKNNLFENNYKFGFNAVIAIPNRKSIGDYKSARIKIKSTELDRSFAELGIENKVRFHYNEVLNLQQQIRICENVYRNYKILFEAEQLKFSFGETTLFLLNARETKLLEAQQKLLELTSKFYQAFAALNWAAGILQ